MADYKLYFMTPDGHIQNAASFVCETDEEALLHAEDQRGDQAIELWTGARVVAKIPRRQDA